jgi:peptidyl-prolyl cis-trans isomerase SurA
MQNIFKNWNTKVILTALFFVIFSTTFAQKKQKIDGVAAVVGEFVILESDLDLMLLEMTSNGMDTKGISRCQLLDKQLQDKLYAHQAIQDSVEVTDEEIDDFYTQQYSQMVEQIGSPEKVFDYFKKKNEIEFKTYFKDIIRMNKLTGSMQRKITENISVTPEEVKQYFNSLKPEEVPTFSAEVEIANIIVKPQISKEDKQLVIDRLKEIKNDVLNNGASFFSKAVIYSEDPGSSSNGGYYKINKKTNFVKEFKEVAFRLAEGEISEPFETDFGFHIIMVDKIIGQDIELRHILLTPKVTQKAASEAYEKIKSIKEKINNKEISFEEAAKASSDEKETKNNGGLVNNPRTGETMFELTKLDPLVYNQIKDLEEGQMTDVVVEQEKNSPNKVFKLIKINKKTKEHQASFSSDYLKIKELAMEDKQLKEIKKWMGENIDKNYIKINEDYKSCTFDFNWLKTPSN